MQSKWICMCMYVNLRLCTEYILCESSCFVYKRAKTRKKGSTNYLCTDKAFIKHKFTCFWKMSWVCLGSGKIQKPTKSIKRQKMWRLLEKCFNRHRQFKCDFCEPIFFGIFYKLNWTFQHPNNINHFENVEYEWIYT